MYLLTGIEPARCLDLTRHTCTPCLSTGHLGVPDGMAHIRQRVGFVLSLKYTRNGGMCHMSVG
jgi:hypothetical protein